jgi:predicted GNAT family acetyltransferase
MDEITDDRSNHRFVTVIDGHEAELVYERTEGKLVLVHTGVPEELGGRGLGGKLVQAAVDVAANEGLVVVPRCPFARGWLEKHPDEAAAVTVELP